MKKKELNSVIEQWRQYYIQMGIDKDVQSVYLGYAYDLLSKDLPPIFDFQHLCAIVGIDDDVLAAMVNHPCSFYRTFAIPKRKGGTREISAPYPSIKYVQTWILRNILQKIKIHGCAHGYVPKRSVLTNVAPHVEKKCLLKLDIKDFFPSIKIEWVIKVFKNLGYEHHVAFYLASLCCCNGVLPQGAPTSPTLSNIVALHLDRRLYRLAKQYNLAYTRYADDIAFSGEIIPVRFIQYVAAITEDCGLKLNFGKIHLYNEHGSKILTGVSLANGRLRLPRGSRRKLENELYYIEKYGYDNHIRHIRNRKANYLESLIGKVGFWLQIEPENEFALRMKAFLDNELYERQSISK